MTTPKKSTARKLPPAHSAVRFREDMRDANTPSRQIAAFARAFKAGLAPSAIATIAGTKLRMVYYNRDVCAYVAAAKVPAADIDEIGLTRLLALAQHTKPAAFPKWRQAAMELNTIMLTDRLTKGHAAPKLVVFTLPQHDAEELSKALVMAGAGTSRGRLTGKNEALMKIARAWVRDQRKKAK